MPAEVMRPGLSPTLIAAVNGFEVGRQTLYEDADPPWKKHVDFYLGSSTDPAIVAQIRKRVRGGRTMVALDADHSRAHVLPELRMYSPMVSRGAYLIVEDGNIDGIPTNPAEGPGPMAALAEFLSEGGREQFERDFSRESMAITFNPGGWLRRN